MQLTKKILFFLISACLLVMLINLNKLPIAWVDEIMLIDPAYNLIEYGKYIGKVWPHTGSEKIFLAYLPLASWIHLIDLSIFPHELFYTRIFWFVSIVLSGIMLYKYMDVRYHCATHYLLLLVLIFILDEGINNSFRSGRVEILEVLLLISLFYLNYKRSAPYLQAVLLGLLSISHPSVYPIILILSIQLLLRKQSHFKRFTYLIIIATPLFIYLAMAQFNFDAIYQQLIVHGKEHDQTAVNGNAFYLHFIERFLPTYKVQPYMIILNLMVHVLCIYNIFVRKGFINTTLEWCFLSISIFWFFSLAPFYRYTPVISLMIFLLVPDLFRRILSIAGYLRIRIYRTNVLKIIALYCLLLVIAAPFVIRNSTAILQAEERDEYGVYTWLDEYIHPVNKKPILIIDESIGFFYAMNRKGVDFTLPYAVKKYSFDDYSEIYYLTHRDAPQDQQLLAEYRTDIPTKNLKFIPQQKILTYKGMRLYKIKDQASLQALQRGYSD